MLGEGERVLDVHPEIAHRALDLGVTQEQLHRPQIAGCLVDDRRLGPGKRVRAIVLAPQPDCCHPLVHEPGILPSADMVRVVGATREGIVVNRAAPVLQPRLEAGPSCFEQLELDRPAGLLLRDCGSRSHPAAADELTNPNFYDVAATQLAVDGKVEQSFGPEDVALGRARTG